MDLHPFIVHFPIALLLTGILCDTTGILLRRGLFLNLGYLLLILGAVSAIVAALTGDSAAETARKIQGIRKDLNLHNNFSTLTVWFAINLALFRTHLTFKKRFTGLLRLIYLIFALATSALIATSSYTGGRLVYKYGAGTEPIIRILNASENMD